MNLTKLERKKFRVRNKVKKVSSKERFRLCVSRSTKNISAQIIDDEKNITLAADSSDTKQIKFKKKTKKELSSIVASILAKKAKEMNITKVYFDRGIYKYHGRIKLLAEELRKNGMEF
jgi:large subunit ribosomal protein L18